MKRAEKNVSRLNKSRPHHALTMSKETGLIRQRACVFRLCIIFIQTRAVGSGVKTMDKIDGDTVNLRRRKVMLIFVTQTDIDSGSIVDGSIIDMIILIY